MDPIFHLMGWYGERAHGDDLLEHVVRGIFDAAARRRGVRLRWTGDMGSATYVIVGGGTLLGVDSMGIAPKLVGGSCPYSLFGTGFRREVRALDAMQRRMLGELIAGADRAFVRGYHSQQFCVHAGAPAPAVIGDPAFAFQPPAAGTEQPRHDYEVGVSLRSMGRTGEPQYLDNARMLEVIASVMEGMAERRSCRFHLLDLADNACDVDADANDALQARLGDRLAIERLRFDDGFEAQFRAIPRFDSVISQRLHPSIVAWANGVPHVAFDYQNAKTADFMGSIGMGEFCLSTLDFTPERYFALYDRLEAERETVREQALASAAHWRSALLRGADAIVGHALGSRRTVRGRPQRGMGALGDFRAGGDSVG